MGVLLQLCFSFLLWIHYVILLSTCLIFKVLLTQKLLIMLMTLHVWLINHDLKCSSILWKIFVIEMKHKIKSNRAKFYL